MSSNWLTVRSVVLVTMVLTATGTAQQQPEPQRPGSPKAPDAPAQATDRSPDGQIPQPVFRAEINFVRVDAIVTDDDDNLVLDLMAEEFEIYEDDTLQQIESFELVQFTGEPDPLLPPPSKIGTEYDQDREASRSDSRIFVFFLDEYHVRDTNAMRMLAPLVEFVETQLVATDLVAVMYHSSPAITRRSCGHSRGSKAASTDTSRATCSRRNTLTIRRRWSSRFGTT